MSEKSGDTDGFYFITFDLK